MEGHRRVQVGARQDAVGYEEITQPIAVVLAASMDYSPSFMMSRVAPVGAVVALLIVHCGAKAACRRWRLSSNVRPRSAPLLLTPRLPSCSARIKVRSLNAAQERANGFAGVNGGTRNYMTPWSPIEPLVPLVQVLPSQSVVPAPSDPWCSQPSPCRRRSNAFNRSHGRVRLQAEA